MKKEDQFNPENKIVKLCAAGMEMEGAGNPDAALKLYKQAWNEATNDHENSPLLIMLLVTNSP